MAAAKQALKNAIEAQDMRGQIKAQEQIATLTMDAARLNNMKVAEESKPKEVNVTPQQTITINNNLILWQKPGQLKTLGLVMIQR